MVVHGWLKRAAALAVLLCFSAPAIAQDGSMSIHVSRIEPSLWSKIGMLVFLGLLLLAILIVLCLIIMRIVNTARSASRRGFVEPLERTEYDLSEHQYDREITTPDDEISVEKIDYRAQDKTKISLEDKEKLDDNDIERFLKSDEKMILDILRRKGGTCSQGTLTAVSNFSKAKVSELLKELEERRVLYRKRKGRSNIVFLK